MPRLSIVVALFFVLGGGGVGCGDDGPELEDEPSGENRDAGSTDPDVRDTGMEVDGGDDVDSMVDVTDVGDDAGADTDAGGCPDLEAGTASCSEPSSCPEPDQSKDPTISCYTPEVVSASDDTVTLDLYGKHLTQGQSSPERLDYSQRGSSFTYRATRFALQSDCHISAELDLSEIDSLACGQTIRFRLVRTLPDSTSDERIRSEAYQIRVTE